MMSRSVVQKWGCEEGQMLEKQSGESCGGPIFLSLPQAHTVTVGGHSQLFQAPLLGARGGPLAESAHMAAATGLAPWPRQVSSTGHSL